MQSMLRSCSSRSFPPLYEISFLLPQEVWYRRTPCPCLICHGCRWCGDSFVTSPLPAFSLRGSHPSKSVIGGLQVTSGHDMQEDLVTMSCTAGWRGVQGLSPALAPSPLHRVGAWGVAAAPERLSQHRGQKARVPVSSDLVFGRQLARRENLSPR